MKKGQRISIMINVEQPVREENIAFLGDTVQESKKFSSCCSCCSFCSFFQKQPEQKAILRKVRPVIFTIQ